LLILTPGSLVLGSQAADDAHRRAFDQDHGAQRCAAADAMMVPNASVKPRLRVWFGWSHWLPIPAL
jgi:hypothetical protein